MIGMIPDNGIDAVELYTKATKKIHISDFIDALDCMYLIGTININQNNIIYKLC